MQLPPTATTRVPANAHQAARALIEPKQELAHLIHGNLFDLDDEPRSLGELVRGINESSYASAITSAIAGARSVTPNAERDLVAVEHGLAAVVELLHRSSTDWTPIDETGVDHFLSVIEPHLEAVARAARAVDPSMGPRA